MAIRETGSIRLSRRAVAQSMRWEVCWPKNKNHREDGASDWPILLRKQKSYWSHRTQSRGVFGCWTPRLARRLVLPVFEERKGKCYTPSDIYERVGNNPKMSLYTGRTRLTTSRAWTGSPRRRQPRHLSDRFGLHWPRTSKSSAKTYRESLKGSVGVKNIRARQHSSDRWQ